MALEDRIASSLDTALARLTSRLEQDVRELVEQIVSIAADERDKARDAARRDALEESAREIQQQLEAAEARLRASLDGQLASAREDERGRVALEVRKIVEAEAEQKLADALAAAETRLKLAVADAENRAERRLRSAVADVRVQEREWEMASVSRLLDSIRGLDGATTLSEVLDALGRAVSREAARTAVFVLRGDRLIAWKLSGFGARDSQPKLVELGLNEGGVVSAAVGAARAATTRDGGAASMGPVFAPLPPDRMGLAVPIIVGGRVVAAVYADTFGDGAREQPVPSSWPETIELLVRHAGRCLEALTVQKAAASPSPRFWVGGAPKGAPAAAPIRDPETPMT